MDNIPKPEPWHFAVVDRAIRHYEEEKSKFESHSPMSMDIQFFEEDVNAMSEVKTMMNALYCDDLEGNRNED